MIKVIKPHEERMLNEQHDLCDKVIKLADFLSKDKPDFISDDEWALMNLQLSAMSMYQSILAQRIKKFI